MFPPCGSTPVIFTLTQKEKAFCTQRCACYTGFTFIPHTIQTPAPSALAFTAGASRKAHLKKPQTGVMFLCSHKRSLAESQTQNAFSFSINNTGVPPGDRNRYNFKALELVCFNVPVFQNLVKW